MNVQAHMSGQIAGRVPSQGGLPHQYGNALQPSQVQNLGASGIGGGVSLPSYMDSDFLSARESIRGKIMDILKQRQQPLPMTDEQRLKYPDIAKRLEEGLFKTATSKEEYMNDATLELRLANLVKGNKGPHNERHPQLVNSSTPVGTMIPTPGISHGANTGLMATSSIDTSMPAAPASIAPPSIGGEALLSAGSMNSGSFNRSEAFSNGYQQSASNYSSGMASMGTQRLTSQMIPTPGFNGSSTNNSMNNQVYLNNQSCNGGGGISSVDSTVVSQPQQQKQHGGQNSRILHTLGSQMGSGARSGLQQKAFGFSNGSMNGALGMTGNNMNIVNEPMTSGRYPSASSFTNSSKSLQQHFDQHQHSLIHADGYGMGNTDSFASGNLYGNVTNVGSVTNTQNVTPVSMQSMSRANPSLISNQSNLHGLQPGGYMKSQSIDQFEKMNFQTSVSSRENLLHSHQQQQFQQQSHQYHHQHPHQILQQKLQTQQQLNLLNNNTYGQPQLASDVGSQVKHEPGVEHHDELLHAQPTGYLLPEYSNQFSQNQADDHTAYPEMSSSISQNSQQMQQVLHQHQSVPEFLDDFSSVGMQSQSLLQGQWHHHSQDGAQVSGNIPAEQQVHENFRPRTNGHDEAQRNYMSSDGSINSQTIGPKSAMEPTSASIASSRSMNGNREGQYRNQYRWLLFLRHARRCTAPEGKCPESHCSIGQKLCRHLDSCNSPQCSYPRCRQTKILINHHRNCRDTTCPVCVPVKNIVRAYQQKARARINSATGLVSSINGSCKTHERGDISAKMPSKIGTSEELQPSLKRMKLDPSPKLPGSDMESPALPNSAAADPQALHVITRNSDVHAFVKSEPLDAKMDAVFSSGKGSPGTNERKKDSGDDVSFQKIDPDPVVRHEHVGVPKQENVKLEKETDTTKQETAIQSAENAAGTKSGKPKIKGVSLTELFTPDQVREHITGLRQWVGQSKAKVEKNQAMEHSMSENSCQLCAVERLTFEPPPIYCSPCGARIKRNAMYYAVAVGDTRHFFCIPCYNESRGEAVYVDGNPMLKTRLEKKKNDEETEEWWVQCDKCEAWQHQICALFNGKRNDKAGGDAEYTCPNCYIAEVERGERKPLPQSAVLGAKDLPRTILSDHIEQRLFKKLRQERQDRARQQGKSYDEVPGAEALVVRVVSSVNKKLEVKQRFLEIFQEENYAPEFPYKSKVVLLFQKIEGVEVCLFGMYVQEFGSECSFPNQRRVYLSYLDSVKYFRPEVKAVTGEALRTFVYHEILIGYLEYCKKRGFTSCYIWACPPLKGEDYILYCHPEIQKTPKSDKLRDWYLAMLRKASKEQIVAETTNLFDHFFVSTGECKAKVTASRLPYFDGDYWPGAAEDLINQFRQEEDGRKQNKKGTVKKTITKRALKASGHFDLSANASKDLLLMHKLGETISPMKEDFIMVHLQHCCNHCCILMVSGNRWVCNQCKNFQICDKCYELEQKCEERERHPVHHRDKHTFYRVEITDVPVDTKDKDEILESEFFDTRQAFLSLCQGNHYQYDTLRRAKHSSMMVLYHLHNPSEPAFVTTCNICHLDIESGQGWHCESCPEYDVCNSCYRKNGPVDHPHKLTNYPSNADRDAQNAEARQQRVIQLSMMLKLLVHASQCRSPQCQYPNCRKVKALFRHGMSCKTRASRGCTLCQQMWHLLRLHARACIESECNVPRCRDLKEHLVRAQHQSDSRRRAAVMEMMRQRAAEVAGSSG